MNPVINFIIGKQYTLFFLPISGILTSVERVMLPLEYAHCRIWVIFYGQSKYLCKEDYTGLVKTPSSPPERTAAAPRPSLPADYWTDGFRVYSYFPTVCSYMYMPFFFAFLSLSYISFSKYGHLLSTLFQNVLDV